MRIETGREILVYEDIIKAAQPFIFSRSPEKCAQVARPVRRIIRWSEAKKAELADYKERTRQAEAALKAQKRMARLEKLSAASNQDHDPTSSSAAPIDPSELRQILSAFEPFLQSDAERDELISLTTRHLQGLPGATPLFKQFTRMLRGRARG